MGAYVTFLGWRAMGGSRHSFFRVPSLLYPYPYVSFHLRLWLASTVFLCSSVRAAANRAVGRADGGAASQASTKQPAWRCRFFCATRVVLSVGLLVCCNRSIDCTCNARCSSSKSCSFCAARATGTNLESTGVTASLVSSQKQGLSRCPINAIRPLPHDRHHETRTRGLLQTERDGLF